MYIRMSAQYMILEMKLGGLDFRRLYMHAIMQIKEIFPPIRGVVVFPSSSKIVERPNALVTYFHHPIADTIPSSTMRLAPTSTFSRHVWFI